MDRAPVAVPPRQGVMAADQTARRRAMADLPRATVARPPVVRRLPALAAGREVGMEARLVHLETARDPLPVAGAIQGRGDLAVAARGLAVVRVAENRLPNSMAKVCLRA